MSSKPLTSSMWARPSPFTVEPGEGYASETVFTPVVEKQRNSGLPDLVGFDRNPLFSLPPVFLVKIDIDMTASLKMSDRGGPSIGAPVPRVPLRTQCIPQPDAWYMIGGRVPLPAGEQAVNNTGESAPIPDEMPQLPKQAHARKAGALRPEVLGERLRAARLSAHLTQQEVAGERWSKSYISAIERGKMVPSLQALKVLAKRLAVPLSYLLGESEIDARALEESSSVVHAAAYDRQIDEEEARRRLGLAETFIRQDRPESAWEQLGERDEPPAGWPLLLCPHWAWLTGWTLYLLDRSADAVPCLERGLQLAWTLRRRAARARQAYWDEMIEWLHCFLGVAHCALGQTALALEYYQRGLEAIEQGRVGNAELKLFIYKGLGNEYFGLARYQEAVGCYRKALAEVENSDNQRQHGLAAGGLARAYQQQGDVFRAKTYYGQAVRILEEYGNQPLLAQIRALYGLALVNLADFVEAEHQLRLSLQDARQAGDSRACGMALAYFASLHNARGEPDQAIQAAQASLPFAQQSGDRRVEGHALFKLVAAHTARKDWAAAEQAYREAIRLAEEILDYEMLSQARQGYADFLAGQARFQEAYRELALMGAGAPGPVRG